MHPRMSELLEFFNGLPAEEMPDANFFSNLSKALGIEDIAELSQLSPDVQNSLASALNTLWLEKGYSMNALHFAAYLGKINEVKALKTLGFDTEARDAKGCSALHYAAFSGNCALMRLLITQHGLNPKEQDKTGATVLDWANKGGNPETILFSTEMETLLLLQKQYGEDIKKIKKDLQNAAPLPLLGPITSVIAGYLAPSDNEYSKIRLLEKIQKIKEQEDIVQDYYNFRLRCLITWALAGSMVFAIGVTAMVLAPFMTVIPIAVMVSILGCMNLIAAIYALAINKHPERFNELPVDEQLYTLESHGQHFNEHNYNSLFENKGVDLPGLVLLGVNHGGGLLFLGLVMLTLCYVFPVGLVPFYFGLSTTAVGGAALALLGLGIYKYENKMQAYDDTQKEIDDIPSY